VGFGQDTGERNYHLLYALALGAPAALRADLELTLPNGDLPPFGYIAERTAPDLQKTANEWWGEVDEAIGLIGFTPQERADVRALLFRSTCFFFFAVHHETVPVLISVCDLHR
jgi:hypothetical protein